MVLQSEPEPTRGQARVVSVQLGIRGCPLGPTVDGRNLAPVDRWFISLFIGRWCSAGFLPSTVVGTIVKVC